MEHFHSPEGTPEKKDSLSRISIIAKMPAFQNFLDKISALADQGVNGPYYNPGNDDEAQG